MESDDADIQWYYGERAFILFMITVSELGLSSEATGLLRVSRAIELSEFLKRNGPKFRSPKGILLL